MTLKKGHIRVPIKPPSHGKATYAEHGPKREELEEEEEDKEIR